MSRKYDTHQNLYCLFILFCLVIMYLSFHEYNITYPTSMSFRITNRVNGETYVTEGNLTFYSSPGIYAGRGSTGWNTTSKKRVSEIMNRTSITVVASYVPVTIFPKKR